MKSTRNIFKFSSILTLLVFSWSFLFFPTIIFASSVEVPVGTTVLTVFNNTVDPELVSPGQTIMLSVVEAVLVNGITVIEAGAPVLAEVTVAEKSGAIGKPAKIGVTLRYVTAVDGTKIPLSGQKLMEGENQQTASLIVTILCCILGLLMQGGKVTIPAGSQLQATTMSTVTVNVKNWH